MKRILSVTAIILLTVSLAIAEWQVNFEETYSELGIDQAVIDALKEGVTPDNIVEKGLAFEGLNPQNLVKALYCAGANGQDILDASGYYGISDVIISAGYKKSVEECSDQIADTQAYTPVANTVSFGGAAGPSSGGTFSSPSTF